MLARLAPASVATAEALLRAHTANDTLPFATSTTTHFATLTVIPEQVYEGETLPPTLMIATSFCGPWRDHVHELVELMQPELRALLACCEEFDPHCAEADLEAFLVDHREGDTFYSGMQHLGPQDVRDQQKLRTAIEAELERDASGTPVEIHARVRDAILARSELAWAREPFEPTLAAWWALHWRSVVMLAIAVPFLLVTIGSFVATMFTASRAVALTARIFGGLLAGAIGFVLLLLVGVRYAETQQRYVAKRQPDANVRKLAATQNRAVINEVTICGPIKEGVTRPLFMRMALWIVGRAAEGIPLLMEAMNIPTVATARWVAADGGRRLIFISNFTNAAEPYVRDFIDAKGGAQNINLSFGFGRGYPPTRWVMGAGALADPNAFIYVVTENQHETLYWYGPYRDLSIDNIKINRRIREGLCVEHSDESARAWLNLLGGDLGPPRKPADPLPKAKEQLLETEDIQGLVVRGYGQLEHAKFLLLAVDSHELARAYLRRLLPMINTAKVSPGRSAYQVAFTAAGLAALGVPKSARDSFSREFLEGMTEETRAISLGDIDKDLGWTDQTIHALVAIYADTHADLERLVSAELADMKGGFTPVSVKSSAILDSRKKGPDGTPRELGKEHFGWRDGISMPKFEGVPTAPGAKKKDQQTWTREPLRAGEFVLGYRNEYDCFTESPTVELGHDPYNHLELARDRASKDLGKNGTYLVFRELAQKPHDLWKYLAEVSREPGATPIERAVALGSKMVGRWPGGAPVLHASHDDHKLRIANEFTYRSDPNGLGCPLGSHIRRANPRDMLAADRDKDASVGMVRRHQMVRRGRPFGESVSKHVDPAEILSAGPDATPRGLHFICLVGHISRQFEFVQRAWLNSPNFAALSADGDPLTTHRQGAPNPNAQFTCPAEPVRRKYKGMPEFTTLVGGGYFFLPGLRALKFIARQP